MIFCPKGTIMIFAYGQGLTPVYGSYSRSLQKLGKQCSHNNNRRRGDKDPPLPLLPPPPAAAAACRPHVVPHYQNIKHIHGAAAATLCRLYRREPPQPAVNGSYSSWQCPCGLSHSGGKACQYCWPGRTTTHNCRGDPRMRPLATQPTTTAPRGGGGRLATADHGNGGGDHRREDDGNDDEDPDDSTEGGGASKENTGGRWRRQRRGGNDCKGDTAEEASKQRDWDGHFTAGRHRPRQQ